MKNYNLKFKILPHTADLKIQAYGKTKEELFLNMLSGMQEGMKPEIKSDEKIKREIKIKSSDLSSLLVDFLSEALYLSEINQEVYQKIQFKKFSDPSTGSGQAEIEGTLIGKKLKRIGIVIKGVTYHGLEIHQKEDGSWEATVLFDI